MINWKDGSTIVLAGREPSIEGKRKWSKLSSSQKREYLKKYPHSWYAHNKGISLLMKPKDFEDKKFDPTREGFKKKVLQKKKALQLKTTPSKKHKENKKEGEFVVLPNGKDIERKDRLTPEEKVSLKTSKIEYPKIKTSELPRVDVLKGGRSFNQIRKEDYKRDRDIKKKQNEDNKEIKFGGSIAEAKRLKIREARKFANEHEEEFDNFNNSIKEVFPHVTDSDVLDLFKQKFETKKNTFDDKKFEDLSDSDGKFDADAFNDRNKGKLSEDKYKPTFKDTFEEPVEPEEAEPEEIATHFGSIENKLEDKIEDRFTPEEWNTVEDEADQVIEGDMPKPPSPHHGLGRFLTLSIATLFVGTVILTYGTYAMAAQDTLTDLWQMIAYSGSDEYDSAYDQATRNRLRKVFSSKNDSVHTLMNRLKKALKEMPKDRLLKILNKYRVKGEKND